LIEQDTPGGAILPSAAFATTMARVEHLLKDEGISTPRVKAGNELVDQEN
jgi:hypothetical protein